MSLYKAMGFSPITERENLLELSHFDRGYFQRDSQDMQYANGLDATLLTELVKCALPEKDIFEMRRKIIQGENDDEVFKFIVKSYGENLRKSYAPLVGFASDIGDIVSRYSTQGNSEALIDYDGTYCREFDNGPVDFIAASSKPVDSYISKVKSRYYSRESNPVRDVLRVRIVVRGSADELDDVEMCYSLFEDINREYLGKIHHIKDRFKNPIFKTDPKGILEPDFYKTIHLYVSNFEIQIRTKDIEDKCNNPNSVLYHPHYKKSRFGFHHDSD